MKNYNPVSLYLNMPVEYIAIADAETNSKVRYGGHFAFYDYDGYPYVWESGGTSYNRIYDEQTKTKQVVKCELVFPMTDKSQGVIRTNNISQLINHSSGGVKIPK